MRRKHIVLSLAIGLLTLLPSLILAQKINRKLVERAEDMLKDIEKAEKQFDKTIDKYNDLLKKKDVKGRQKEFKKLKDEMKKSEDRAKDVRKRTNNMQKEADKYFGNWEKGIQDIRSRELRAMSQESLDDAQQPLR